MNSNATKNVLIVEDDMLLSLVEERLLQKLGYNVIGKAGSGEEAIQKAEELNPDLIVMDIILKGQMDGIEAMESIRKHSDVPVVYLSGNSDQYNYDRAKKTGFTEYLIKPITCNDLKEPLDKIFGGCEGVGNDSEGISESGESVRKKKPQSQPDQSAQV